MAKTASTMLPLGTQAPHFALPDIYGKTYKFDEKLQAKGYLIAFICNHCPFVVHIQQSFVKLAKELQEQGLEVIAISSNDVDNYPEDGPDKMKELALKHSYTFPYLYDETQQVAHSYQAACTPDFYLFDAQQKLVYRGQMDESRPGNQAPNDGQDIRNACELMLAGRAPLEEQRASMGCNIKWKAGNEPSYYGKT